MERPLEAFKVKVPLTFGAAAEVDGTVNVPVVIIKLFKVKAVEPDIVAALAIVTVVLALVVASKTPLLVIEPPAAIVNVVLAARLRVTPFETVRFVTFWLASMVTLCAMVTDEPATGTDPVDHVEGELQMPA